MSIRSSTDYSAAIFGGGYAASLRNQKGATAAEERATLWRQLSGRRARIVTDVRAQKNFTFEGKYTLELMGELFNAANHQNVTFVNTTGYTFSGNNLNYNSGAGRVTNANSNYAYSPRQVQLAVRLQF